jgi:hypothetical protein
MKLDFDPVAIVQLAARKGLCTPPKFTPHRSNKQLYTILLHTQGLTSHGTIPKRSSITGVPRNVAELLTDFLRQFTDPFVVLDFQLFLIRSNVNLKSGIISTYLSRAVEAGVLVRVGRRPTLTRKASCTVYQSAKFAQLSTINLNPNATH